MSRASRSVEQKRIQEAGSRRSLAAVNLIRAQLTAQQIQRLRAQIRSTQ